MAGVLNRTARQFNIRARTGQGITVVRLKPGINYVDDKSWSAVEGCDFVKKLREESSIDFADKKVESELAGIDEGDVKNFTAQTKTTPVKANSPNKEESKTSVK